MGYFENLNIDDYNLDTDGEVRYIDGALRFVPWMEGIEDTIYKGCVENL